MLDYRDKLTLTALNAINKEEKIIDYILKFPIDEESFSLPENLLQISIFEYHEGIEIYGHEVFKIYVGGVTSIREIIDDKERKWKARFKKSIFNGDISPEDKLCYTVEKDEKHYVHSILNPGDIVVSNIEDLKNVLLRISNNYKKIQESILEINSYSEESDVVIKKKVNPIIKNNK